SGASEHVRGASPRAATTAYTNSVASTVPSWSSTRMLRGVSCFGFLPHLSLRCVVVLYFPSDKCPASRSCLVVLGTTGCCHQHCGQCAGRLAAACKVGVNMIWIKDDFRNRLSCIPVGDVNDVARIPGFCPSQQFQHPVEDHGGKSPDQCAAYAKSWSAVTVFCTAVSSHSCNA